MIEYFEVQAAKCDICKTYLGDDGCRIVVEYTDEDMLHMLAENEWVVIDGEHFCPKCNPGAWK